MFQSFNKLKGITINEIIIKVYNKIIKKIYYAGRKIKIKINPINIEDRWFCDFNANNNFIFDINNKKVYIDKINNLNLKDSIIYDADKICNHIFNLLGSGDKKLGDKLPWNEDFKVGFKWKNKFYKDIKIVDLKNNADVKVPWELSRFQHIFTLGKAYWITKSEKYAMEFKNEILDWIERNPVEMSVNWTCTMDVGIRAVNWITGYFFFKNSKSIDKKFCDEFNKSLYLHGRFIINNLENDGKNTGNHYLSNIVGLAWLGVYFGEFFIDDDFKSNNPKEWLRYSIKELEKEMFVQVNNDGTNYEASTSYHRLVTELFLITTILFDKNKIKFSNNYMTRLEKMCEFVMNITKPNGLSPLIGDADDGRLLILSNYYDWVRKDFTHILAIAGEYFDRDDFRYYGSKHKEDALWVTGDYKENVKLLEKVKSKSYENGGYYILRNERVYCIIRCGELSFRGDGVHSHNDQLSFELNVDGEDVIVDPGVYVYTADYNMRNLFRSTRVHNTLSIDGYEQNDFDKYNLFYMKEQTFAECIKFNEYSFEGRHFGYKDKCGIIHNRKIVISDFEIEIIDKVNEEVNYKLNYILNENIKINNQNEEVELKANDLRVAFEFDNEYSLENCEISKAYGEIETTKKISIQCSENSKLLIRI